MTDEKEELNLDDLTKGAEEDGEDIEVEVDGDAGSAGVGFSDEDQRDPAERLEAIYDVPVQVSAVLGKATMPIAQLIKLGRGAILELDRKVGEPVDIVVNNRLVARGEVVIVDERIGITMTEIIKSES
ncbi:MAG: flagellar motor switch protein FliN [Geminicoccaceae bacterium]